MPQPLPQQDVKIPAGPNSITVGLEEPGSSRSVPATLTEINTSPIAFVVSNFVYVNSFPMTGRHDLNHIRFYQTQIQVHQDINYEHSKIIIEIYM